MLDILPFECSGLHGRIYNYKKAGLKLHEHKHSAKDNHVCFVMQGSAFFTVDSKHFNLGPGEMLTMREGATHSIEATEDNTVVLHLNTHPPSSFGRDAKTLKVTFESVREQVDQ